MELKDVGRKEGDDVLCRMALLKRGRQDGGQVKSVLVYYHDGARCTDVGRGTDPQF